MSELFNFTAREKTELRQKIEDGSATVDEILRYIDIEVEMRVLEIVTEKENELAKSDLQAVLDYHKAEAKKAQLELEELTANAIKGLENGEE